MELVGRGRAASRAEGLDLEALYRARATGAVRLAYALTGDCAAAEDVAHEAFVRVGSKLATLKDPTQAETYLTRTIVNLCRGRARRLKIERAALARIAKEGARPQPDVETRDELWAALLRLPTRQRAALVLRYYEDLSEDETATLLGCSVSAVKSLVNRGLKRMRRELDQITCG